MIHLRSFALAAMASLALLAGCAGFIERPRRPAVFDLGPLPPPSSPAQRVQPRAPLLLPDIEASGALDGTPVLYRLGYADDHQLRAYSQSRWSAPPPQLVRQRLRQQLGRERPVLSLDEGAALDRAGPGRAATCCAWSWRSSRRCSMRPDRSKGVVRLRATLLAHRQQRRAAARPAQHRRRSAPRPRPTPRAACVR